MRGCITVQAVYSLAPFSFWRGNPPPLGVAEYLQSTIWEVTMKRNNYVLALMVLLVLILSGSAALFAQVNTATLSGTVTDPQGLGLKSAKVTVVNRATGAERSIVADESGRYAFVGLPPGAYKMTVDGGSGFNSFTAENLVVTVGEDAT